MTSRAHNQKINMSGRHATDLPRRRDFLFPHSGGDVCPRRRSALPEIHSTFSQKISALPRCLACEAEGVRRKSRMEEDGGEDGVCGTGWWIFRWWGSGESESEIVSGRGGEYGGRGGFAFGMRGGGWRCHARRRLREESVDA